MKALFRLLLIVGLGLGLQACGEKTPEESCGFHRDAEKQRVSWAVTPVKVYIHNSVPPQHLAEIQAAADHWNSVFSSGNVLQIVATNVGGSLEPKRDGFNLVTWLEKWTGDSASEQGSTSIKFSGATIYEADIKINAEDFDYEATPANGGQDIVNLTSLMIHEFGHLLGLAHNNDIDSVMRPQLGFGVERGFHVDEHNNHESDIKAVDVKNLSCEYNVVK